MQSTQVHESFPNDHSSKKTPTFRCNDVLAVLSCTLSCGFVVYGSSHTESTLFVSVTVAVCLMRPDQATQKAHCLFLLLCAACGPIKPQRKHIAFFCHCDFVPYAARSSQNTSTLFAFCHCWRGNVPGSPPPGDRSHHQLFPLTKPRLRLVTEVITSSSRSQSHASAW